MIAFARLLDGLLYSPARNAKLRQIQAYLEETPDPERGWALAALVGDLSFSAAKPAMIRALAAERTDPELFALSYDFVGDLAETVALIWPERRTNEAPPGLTEVVTALQGAKRGEAPGLIVNWLDRLDADGRWALLKLITGGLRVGVSARLAKTAAAAWGKVDPAEVEELWHGLTAPYSSLFAWLSGASPRPALSDAPIFRPPMLAHPLEPEDIDGLDPGAYRAEWKWDGIRVQAAVRGGECRLFSRTGDDIGAAFPDLLAALDDDVVLDGELLVGRPNAAGRYQPAPFNDLQQRLNRKAASAAQIAKHPAFIRVYDLLFDGTEDLRALPLDARRVRLEAWMGRRPRLAMDLSEQLSFSNWDDLAALRESAVGSIEGLMLKRGDSAYVAGRPKGPWFKWKRNALLADCVLMYAQRGHGKRSSFYSDYTFGCWRDGKLTPVGKAYFGFTDAELVEIDKWVRAHTVKRYGPVREVEVGLVFEVAFDSVQRSTRHRSGLAMRFPRISRLRWDKPAQEADEVATLEKLIR
ncbi:MAG: cisplatin damage response ATP-dependent DNA ligase [Elsteraceae bacterium]